MLNLTFTVSLMSRSVFSSLKINKFRGKGKLGNPHEPEKDH